MTRRDLPALAADVVAVAVFVAIGRDAHHHGLTARGLASTAWPFLAALGIGWLVVAPARWQGAGLRVGSVVWAATVVVGMVLRAVGGQGVVVVFVAVAAVFLGLFLLGWRALWALVTRRRGAWESPPVPPARTH